MKKGYTIFKCGKLEHRIGISHRDIHLLDGQYFFGAPNPAWYYRKIFGLDFLAGMEPPKQGECLAVYDRDNLIDDLKWLLKGLLSQEDLISYSYQYFFTSPKEHPERPELCPTGMHSGTLSGIKIRGFIGTISVRPAGYCDLTLHQLTPNNRSRKVEIIDMRVKKEIETEDHGLLKIRRRRAEVGWFEELPKLINFLESTGVAKVEMFH